MRPYGAQEQCFTAPPNPLHAGGNLSLDFGPAAIPNPPWNHKGKFRNDALVNVGKSPRINCPDPLKKHCTGAIQI